MNGSKAFSWLMLVLNLIVVYLVVTNHMMEAMLLMAAIMTIDAIKGVIKQYQ